ncbi:MAG: 16S rRNA (guanine(966)-N(2))-methyltransferase RsmD [Clostridia bacterium]|nr:16S rRNA (guanine(966)-N(2))-methyltransferase RsmD [Clostridia bacterium]
MRIITGTARGTRLETLDGEDITRPTVERVKEAIFSMINFELEGRNVLDLFAGSGQMALEALSRGAASATLCDVNREAIAVIKRNAQKTKLYERTKILSSDYKSAINGCKNGEKFGIVFLDPPYGEYGMLTDALDRMVRLGILSENALIVCESNKKEPVEADGLRVRRFARYGKVYITLLTNAPESFDED